MIPRIMTREFQPPLIVRQAPIPVGAIFSYAGRLLAVVRVYGTDPGAPVIVEEIEGYGSVLPGQYALWSADGVARILYGGRR